eukprot:6201693-Pleurochrysis_carterae.AAC.4
MARCWRREESLNSSPMMRSSWSFGQPERVKRCWSMHCARSPFSLASRVCQRECASQMTHRKS